MQTTVLGSIQGALRAAMFHAARESAATKKLIVGIVAGEEPKITMHLQEASAAVPKNALAIVTPLPALIAQCAEKLAAKKAKEEPKAKAVKAKSSEPTKVAVVKKVTTKNPRTASAKKASARPAARMKF